MNISEKLQKIKFKILDAHGCPITRRFKIVHPPRVLVIFSKYDGKKPVSILKKGPTTTGTKKRVNFLLP